MIFTFLIILTSIMNLTAQDDIHHLALYRQIIPEGYLKNNAKQAWFWEIIGIVNEKKGTFLIPEDIKVELISQLDQQKIPDYMKTIHQSWKQLFNQPIVAFALCKSLDYAHYLETKNNCPQRKCECQIYHHIGFYSKSEDNVAQWHYIFHTRPEFHCIYSSYNKLIEKRWLSK